MDQNRLDKIINIVREQNQLKAGGKLPPNLPGMSGGGGGTNALTSQAKARTIRSMLTDPTGKKAARKFANDPQTKLNTEEMSVGAAGFTGTADPKGPTAGFDPVMDKKPRKRYIYGGRGSRKNWMTNG